MSDSKTLMDQAAEALRVSGRRPGMETDHAWQIKQMHVAVRKVRLAVRQEILRGEPSGD